jgi:hypothetical protein
MPRVTFKIEKQPPAAAVVGSPSDNLELFHGIGNTLGFDLTGGIDFSMPITIFHVSQRRRRRSFLVHLHSSFSRCRHIFENVSRNVMVALVCGRESDREREFCERLFFLLNQMIVNSKKENFTESANEK